MLGDDVGLFEGSVESSLLGLEVGLTNVEQEEKVYHIKSVSMSVLQHM